MEHFEFSLAVLAMYTHTLLNFIVAQIQEC